MRICIIALALLLSLDSSAQQTLDYHKLDQEVARINTGAALIIGFGTLVGGALFTGEDNLQQAGTYFIGFATCASFGVFIHGASLKSRASKLRRASKLT